MQKHTLGEVKKLNGYFDGKLCQECSYQKLSKFDNWFSSCSRKCRGCFFGTQCSYIETPCRCARQISDFTAPLHRYNSLGLYRGGDAIQSRQVSTGTCMRHVGLYLHRHEKIDAEGVALPTPSSCKSLQSLRCGRLSSHSRQMWRHRHRNIQPSTDECMI